MTNSVNDKFGVGLTPQQFVETMTRNQDKFVDWASKFEWASGDEKAFFTSLRGSGLHCFILAADWCGDVVRNVPVVFRVLEESAIPTKVLIMEENLDLMDEYLTMGGRSIPIVLFVNSEGDVVGQWGPRPMYIQEPMVAFKQSNPDKGNPDYEANLKAARQEILRRYGEGTEYQRLIVDELRKVLESIQ